MTTLEQVEKLRAIVNISYEEAKAALDAANGDILEAVIYLEKRGKVQAPAGGGYYSSERTSDTGTGSCSSNNQEKKNDNCRKEKPFTYLKKMGQFCLRMICKGNANSFEVLKGQEIKASFPVTVLALLLIFVFWVTVPLIIIGLFFGLRYRFTGPDFRSNTINDAMNSAADAAENLKKSMNI